jgi:hypothetical protein
MMMRSTLLVSALILSAAVPASAAGDNVLLIDVSKVNVPSSLPGRCQVNGIVNQVWQGKTFQPGEAITIAVPCNAADSVYRTPVQAVPSIGVHFIAADVLQKSKRGLARIDDAGTLIWTPSPRTYGPWGVAMGFRVLDAASVPAAPDRVKS